MTRLGGIVSAVQQGFSKKSGKPYALLTLEDLEGSVQLLCLAETCETYRDLFAQGRALFVVGEVSVGEDRPKIFPTELYPLEDAPRRLTKQVQLRFRTSELDVSGLRAARELIMAHPGECPLFLCFIRPDASLALVEVNDRYRVTPSLALQQAVEARFGAAAYFAKADPSLPERQRRRWERDSNGGGENGG